MSNDDITTIHRKLDAILDLVGARPQRSAHLTAEDVGTLTGLDKRTVLNRSAMPSAHHLHIPSFKLRGSNRRMFERKVIERLFEVA